MLVNLMSGPPNVGVKDSLSSVQGLAKVLPSFAFH